MTLGIATVLSAFWAGVVFPSLLKWIQGGGSLQKWNPLFAWSGNVLLLCIGMKAGLSLAMLHDASHPQLVSLVTVGAAGLGWGVVMPRFFTPTLAKWLCWSIQDAALFTGTFGSVSVMTFAMACLFLDAQREAYSGLLALLLLLMELPALLSVIRQWAPATASTSNGSAPSSAPNMRWGASWKHVAGNRVIRLLLGAVIAAYLLASCHLAEWAKGVLQLIPAASLVFLFGQGVSMRSAWTSLSDLCNARVLLAALGLPLIQGALGLAVAWQAGCEVGNATLFAVLMGSASYLAAPALLGKFFRSDKLSLCTAVSLSVTFPFNVLVGIPLWFYLAQALIG